MRPNMQLPERAPWQQNLHAFFQRPAVEITVGGLILLSVLLTLIELAIDPTSDYLPLLVHLNDAITWLFVVELTLRFIGFPKKRRFFRAYWIDILAVLPVLRMFRIFRAFRFLRLLRLLRLVGLFRRYATAFPYIFRRGALEYVIILGLIFLTILFGSSALLTFETSAGGRFNTFGDAFWFSIYSLFAGEPIPGPPQSVGGRIVAVVIMFMGLTTFAMLTGTVSAFMVERLRTEGQVVEWDEFQNHTIICGWNRRAEIIVREYQAAKKSMDQPLIVICESDGEPLFQDESIRSRVRFIFDDFTKVNVLEKAGVYRAQTCIILSDLGSNRTAQDADARTILAALTVERLNPDIYTCAELNNREYGAHLEMGHVNDYVVSGEHSGFLLAQAALNRGLTEIVTELLTYERGNQFYRLEISAEWEGKTFFDLFVYMKQTHDAILVAVQDQQGSLRVNPGDYTFQAHDNIIVIASQEIVFPTV